MVQHCGGRFILNHGVARRQGQDTLRFYESTDLHEWHYLFSNQPDRRWYGLPPQPSRWDHMYILPKEEGKPAAGYWGHVVSVPKPGTPPGVGMMESADGRTWTVLPPAAIEWPTGMPPQRYFEYGGCERIGGKYYLIGGTGNYLGNGGYAMFTLVADDPRAVPTRCDRLSSQRLLPRERRVAGGLVPGQRRTADEQLRLDDTRRPFTVVVAASQTGRRQGGAPAFGLVEGQRGPQG